MLIGPNGEKNAIIPIEKALDSAKSLELDLVQVSPSDADVVVCKLLDYGKHLFDKKRIYLHQKLR